MASDEPVAPAMLDVELVYAESPQRLHRRRLMLAPGATVSDALRLGGWQTLLEPPDATAPGALRIGVWGRTCAPDTPLRDRDRVELYRPLQVDPKEARRQRYRRDGVRRAPR